MARWTHKPVLKCFPGYEMIAYSQNDNVTEPPTYSLFKSIICYVKFWTGFGKEGCGKIRLGYGGLETG